MTAKTQRRARARGNREGSVYKRASDGRYVGTAYLNGKRLVVYGRTRKEAVDKKQLLEREIADGLPITSGRGVSTGAVLRQWIAVTLPQRVAAGRLAPGTLDSYRDNTEKHIIPVLGDVPLSALSPAHVRQWLADLAVKPSGRPRRKLREGETGLPPAPVLSPRTVVYCHAILRKALNDAVRDELVKRNVAALAEPPAVSRAEVHPPTRAEAGKLLAAVADDWLSVYWLLLIALGLRRGEGLGLKWEDVDFDAGTIRLRGSIQRQRGNVPDPSTGRRQGSLVRKRLKTPASHATIPVPAVVMEALRAHRVRQAQARLAAVAWEESGLVFTTKIGTPLEPRNINRAWGDVCDRAGVRRVRVHDLRHAFASYLRDAGEDMKSIQEAMRHSRMSTTADLYVHLFEENRRGTADKMNDIITGLRGNG